MVCLPLSPLCLIPLGGWNAYHGFAYGYFKKQLWSFVFFTFSFSPVFCSWFVFELNWDQVNNLAPHCSEGGDCSLGYLEQSILKKSLFVPELFYSEYRLRLLRPGKNLLVSSEVMHRDGVVVLQAPDSILIRYTTKALRQSMLTWRGHCIV